MLHGKLANIGRVNGRGLPKSQPHETLLIYLAINSPEKTLGILGFLSNRMGRLVKRKLIMAGPFCCRALWKTGLEWIHQEEVPPVSKEIYFMQILPSFFKYLMIDIDHLKLF